jgi:hypothetical protein
MAITDVDPFIMSFVNSSFKTMESFVREGTEIIPQIFFFARDKRDNGWGLMPVMGLEYLFQGDFPLNEMRGVFKKVWLQAVADKPFLSLVAVSVAADSYVEDVSDEEFERMLGKDMRGSFKDRPGVMEALFIQLSMADREFHFHWPYVKAGDDVVFCEKRSRSGAAATSDGTVFQGAWPL